MVAPIGLQVVATCDIEEKTIIQGVFGNYKPLSNEHERENYNQETNSDSEEITQQINVKRNLNSNEEPPLPNKKIKI
uniref:Uncharacterized protein n=1 Tax=Trichogramma kaykai TaxID=54128 RepID=A0ABD2WQL6_9HYME